MILLRGIMYLEKQLCQRLVISLRCIKQHSYRLHVSRVSLTYFLVRRIFHFSSNVPGLNGKHAGCLFHVILHSPETSPGKNSRVYFQFFGRNKFHRNRIHTMTGILWGKSLTREHVSQVRSTTSADNLRPSPISIRYPFHRSRNLIIKTRPPAPGIKLILRTVKRAPALFANICPLRLEIIIFTRERSLRPLINNHLFFIRC